MSAKSEVQRNRIYEIQEYGVDTEHFMIYIQGIESNPNDDDEVNEYGVEYRMANRLIKNLDILSGIDTDRPITISMKTCGGIWVEGMAMYDAILTTPNPISIINYTHARSMSSIILQAANKRIMMPHSSFMFHEGTMILEGTPKQVRSEFKFNKVADEQMIEVYVDCLKRSQGKASKWSEKRIKDWLVEQMNNQEDVYLTAKEAIEFGFADEVFTDWESVTKYTKAQKERK